MVVLTHLSAKTLVNVSNDIPVTYKVDCRYNGYVNIQALIYKIKYVSLLVSSCRVSIYHPTIFISHVLFLSKSF